MYMRKSRSRHTHCFPLSLSPVLQRLRERLTLLLLLGLPFHAFVITILTRLIAGPDHAPLTWLAIWKEGVLFVILAIACIEILHAFLRTSVRHFFIDRLKRFFGLRPTPYALRPDTLDILILSLILLGIVVSIFQPSFSFSAFSLGFKYDLLPLLTFLIARRVPWSEWFLRVAQKWILIIGVIVAAFGILSFILPTSFFVLLGYSPIHSLYFSDGPLAAFQMIGDTDLHRIQSVMSGPNQLGLWLLLPWSVLLAKIGQGRGVDQRHEMCPRNEMGPRHEMCQRHISMGIAIALVLGIALLLTFSRSAWIAAFVITVIASLRWIPARLRTEALLTMLGSVCVVGLILVFLFPDVFFRLGSSRGHFDRPIEGMQQMIAHPLGQGLASAGPASHRSHDACVMLRPQDDPSWAKNIPKLCVFVGDMQVQPKDRACSCPLLPENWYVQIGVELGILGFALFIVIIGMLWKRLSVIGRSQDLFLATRFAFIAISIASLFLHAWEDSAIAYSLWLLVGVALQRRES